MLCVCVQTNKQTTTKIMVLSHLSVNKSIEATGAVVRRCFLFVLVMSYLSINKGIEATGVVLMTVCCCCFYIMELSSFHK